MWLYIFENNLKKTTISRNFHKVLWIYFGINIEIYRYYMINNAAIDKDL